MKKAYTAPAIEQMAATTAPLMATSFQAQGADVNFDTNEDDVVGRVKETFLEAW